MRNMYSNQENIGIYFSKQDKINSPRKMTCEANAAGENCSIIFTVCQISSTFQFQACLCSSTYGWQRIFRNAFLEMEI